MDADIKTTKKNGLTIPNSNGQLNALVRRVFEIDMDKMGFWKIWCKGCPLLLHLKALNQESRMCVSGLSTKMQGAIPLQHCEYYVKDSADDNKTIGCRRA